MAITRNTKLTYNGLNLMASCQTGKQLKFTKVIMGDGKITDDKDVRQLAGLINPLLTLNIKNVSITGVGTTVMETELKNDTLEKGFFAREVGIFAAGEDGAEVLYAYRNTGDDSEYIPAGGGSEYWDLLYDVVTVVDQASNVTANISGGIAYVSRVDFYDYTAKAPAFAQAVNTTANFLAADADGNKIHRITLDDTRKTILGDAASTIPIMRARIDQLEIEAANTALTMAAKNDCPDSNLLLAEDFSTPDKIDQYTVAVKSIVAGDNGIDVNSLFGIIPGAWYWVSDGINSEYIQVRSCIKNGSVYRILITNNIVNTYNIPATFIYRTTSLILDSVAAGSGDRKGFVWQPTISFTGEKAETKYSVPLITTQDKAADFDISGDIVFSADGFISLGN